MSNNIPPLYTKRELIHGIMSGSIFQGGHIRGWDLVSVKQCNLPVKGWEYTFKQLAPNGTTYICHQVVPEFPILKVNP